MERNLQEMSILCRCLSVLLHHLQLYFTVPLKKCWIQYLKTGLWILWKFQPFLHVKLNSFSKTDMTNRICISRLQYTQSRLYHVLLDHIHISQARGYLQIHAMSSRSHSMYLHCNKGFINGHQILYLVYFSSVCTVIALIFTKLLQLKKV